VADGRRLALQRTMHGFGVRIVCIDGFFAVQTCPAAPFGENLPLIAEKLPQYND
jgi:hypothetical protein